MVIRWVRLLLWSVLAIALFFLLFSFVLENPTEVTLTILGYPLAPASLSAVVVVGFLLGGLVGIFSGMVLVARFRVRHVLLKRKNEQLEAEVKKLRMNALKGLS
ncbi:LapA family protein [Kistimonas asteriae]|uniref:LapA family protein n=1 Tax=Kistimonas asteriae TaxID=517724 RepID=UPI001BA88D83|nr:LapA family protein [Kistimonas asteriae]